MNGVRKVEGDEGCPHKSGWHLATPNTSINFQSWPCVHGRFMVYPIFIDVSMPETAWPTSLPHASWIKGGIRYLYHLVNYRKAIHPRVVGFRGIKGFA